MTYTEEQKLTIFMKTNGRCHYCGKQLVFGNHGLNGARGSWHIDHSFPKSKGGADSYYNFWPACIDCNLQKSDGSARAFRNRTKSAKVYRQRTAVVPEVKENTLPLALLAGASISAIVGSISVFHDASQMDASNPIRADELRKEAWWNLLLGLALIALIIALVYSISKSHKIA